ncbi:MAG TPA: Lrp/AsnC ligand binding domain-containing protein [Actinomycetota bacterium]|nr:Lrp/AsnC ligand binding domain-containing protein [Actinomycetota bacterium]
MLEAFVLVQNDVGTGAKVVEEISAVPGVRLCQTVTGPYDAIARTTTDDLEALGALVDQIQRIPGVTRTLTCPIIRI